MFQPIKSRFGDNKDRLSQSHIHAKRCDCQHHDATDTRVATAISFYNVQRDPEVSSQLLQPQANTSLNPMATNSAPTPAPEAATAATGVRPTITFMIPPPVTVWFQFDDGTRMAVTPSPQRIASSILNMPLFGGMPFVMSGLGGLFGGGAGGLEQQIHELFMRSQSQQQGPPPTSKDFLEKIPLKTWDSKMKDSEKHTDCAICLCDYEDKDEVLPLPCGHQFHKDCGMKWLLEHNVCPTCRYALPVQENANTTKPAETTPAENTNTTASPASTTQPQLEPESEDDMARASRIRQRSPRHEPERLVRRRLSERDALVLPGSVSNDDDELDSILEEEATRFVAEEEEKQRAANMSFDDVDVEDLLNDTSA